MKYTFDWGDGSSSTSELFAAGVSSYISEHTWTTPGTYTITGTAIPTIGSTVNTTFEVTVSGSNSTPTTPTAPVQSQTRLSVESGVRRDDTIVFSKNTNIKTGENILVRTKITNTGSNTATGIIVRAPLPDGYATFSWAPSPNSRSIYHRRITDS